MVVGASALVAVLPGAALLAGAQASRQLENVAAWPRLTPSTVQKLPDDAVLDPEAAARGRDAQAAIAGREAVACDGIQERLPLGPVGRLGREAGGQGGEGGPVVAEAGLGCPVGVDEAGVESRLGSDSVATSIATLP